MGTEVRGTNAFRRPVTEPLGKNANTPGVGYVVRGPSADPIHVRVDLLVGRGPDGAGRHVGLPFGSRRLPGQVLRHLGLADRPVQQTPRHRSRRVRPTRRSHRSTITTAYPKDRWHPARVRKK